MGVPLSLRLRGQEGTLIQLEGVLPYKLEVGQCIQYILDMLYGFERNFVKVRASSLIRVGFWQNGFFADFHFWAAGIFRGFCCRIFSPHFCGKKCPENPQENPRQYPPKLIQQKSPTHFCRGAGPSLGGRFRSFLFFLLGGGEGGVRGASTGGGGVGLFLKIPGRSSRGGEGGAAGWCLRGVFGGGGGNVFFFFGAEMPPRGK